MALRAIVAATSNPGKLQEFRTLLTGLPLCVASLEGRGPIRFPEEGSDYAANAIAKADAVADQLGQWALADYSGSFSSFSAFLIADMSAIGRIFLSQHSRTLSRSF